MNPAPRSPSARGFTLVEVMMAATILVVGMMGVIQAITIGSELQATARRQMLASEIIQHELEKLRLVPFSQIQTLADQSATTYNDAQFNTAISLSGVTFQLARNVTSLSSDQDLYEVELTVTWTKSGTTAAASGAQTDRVSTLDQLAFFRNSPIQRTYTRRGLGYFGKYGLTNSYQRS